jgi:PiT family inorganic phosphate transporter
MTDYALPGSIEPAVRSRRPDLDKGFNPLTMILFFGVLAARPLADMSLNTELAY